MESMQGNVEFGYQLSICSGIKEKHGKPWSSWPVAGPSDCNWLLASSPALNPRTLTLIPTLCYCIFFLFFSLLFLLELFLRPTVSQPVSLGIGPLFGTLDQILSCLSFFVWQLRYSSFKVTRKRVCSLQCNHSLVRSLTPNNHTLPSHLRLCSLFVSSYDSQGPWWKYSNPPPSYQVINCWFTR
jgi:hypothetical protein